MVVMKNIGNVNLSTLMIIFVAGMLWKITLPLLVIVIGVLIISEKLNIKKKKTNKNISILY